MSEAVQKGALILVCRSQKMDDFAWFKTALLNHLRPLHADQVSVVDIHAAGDLVARLSAPGTLFDVSEVHVLVEYGADRMRVGTAPLESISLGVFSGRPPPRGLSISGGAYVPDTTVRVWYWSDNETPSFTQLLEWSEYFRLRVYFQPLAQLKQRINPARRAASNPARNARHSGAAKKTAADEGPKTPSRTHGAGKNTSKSTSKSTGKPVDKSSGWIQQVSFTNIMLVLAVGAAIHSVFFDSIVDLSDDYVDIVTYKDSSFAIEALTKNLLDRRGESVAHSWVFQRKRWDFTFFVAKQWLADSEDDLVRAEQNAAGYQGHAYWAAVYKDLAWRNAARLDNVADALRRYGERESMDEYELASFILAFVQHIPYKIPNNTLGLLTPPQTVARYYGDCDSKSLLYVLLLRKLGYRVSMFESRRYRHAMAGVAVNASGTSMKYQGVDYYFAETTAVGHRLGSVSPRWNHLSNWQLVPL